MYVKKRTYVCALTVEVTVPTMFMVWLRASCNQITFWPF